MTDLVTDTAIDAALKARWQTGMDWLHGKDETPDTSLRNQLEAAAPHIAAEALRQAAPDCDCDRCSSWCWRLQELADELEEGVR